MIPNKPTGKTRLKPITIGWLFKKVILIHQTELEIEHMEFTGGIIHYEPYKTWVDTKPEWLMEDIK